MANKTNNYKFPKPEADDFYDISEYNKAMDILDDSLTEMDQKKLDKNGDASEAVTEFEQEILRENIESGETLSSTFGKIKKWFTEMKDVAFSGHAKDVTTDAAHRFVSDTEKSSWNGKVGASGGDISETVINNIEDIEVKYPIPVTGELTKVFMGKVKKYIIDTKPLEMDIAVNVSSTGSDTIGDGTYKKPYKTITKALSNIPRNLGGYIATINVADGTYDEQLNINGFYAGALVLQSGTPNKINSNCIIKSIHIYHCLAHIVINAVTINESQDENAITVDLVYSLSLRSIKSIVNNPFTTCIISWRSDIVISDSELSNHAQAIYANESKIFSANNIGSGNKVALTSIGGTLLTKVGTQPGGKNNEVISNGGIISSSYGAKIGTLQQDVVIYIATTGDDFTGDGSNGKPYKTIQYAIDTLPKDLGNNTASIYIADGTYNENIKIDQFHNGNLTIQSKDHRSVNTLCNITRLYTVNCSAYIRIRYMNLIGSLGGGIDVYNSRVVEINYMRCASSNEGNACIYIENSVANITDCLLTNRVYGIAVGMNSRVWAATNTGSNTIGISVGFGGVASLANNSLLPLRQEYGGQFIYENGTQISNLITSGLTCTWANLQGGYYRHGNLNGVAVIIAQIRITLTSNLSSGQQYYISGFPRVANGVDIAAYVNVASQTLSCYMSSAGTISFAPTVNLSPGMSMAISFTYVTNS